MPQNKSKSSSKSSSNSSLRKQKAESIILFSNTPKKTMKQEGYSEEYTNRLYKKHMKSVS